MCIPLSFRRLKTDHPLRILLTNGRFPVTLDLARQLRLDGHRIYVLDPMHYHVCKFSSAVQKSYQVPAPRVDGAGFIKAALRAIEDCNPNIIIPGHEEIFYLAQSKEREIIDRLYAPDWDTLLRLHNKWEFSRLLDKACLDRLAAWLCTSISDVQSLDRTRDLALKPVYGRASSNVYRLTAHSPLPPTLDVSDADHYIAQEWLTGQRYCSYSLIRANAVDALSIYPVQDTIDGSSCVYFRSVEHAGILRYIQRLAASLPPHRNPYQLAFDFIETAERLVAIECNPRATSGIHLFSSTRTLARAVVDAPISVPAVPMDGAKRQLAPGMMMWRRDERGLRAWLGHMRRLMGSKDVVFEARDVWPSLMQPFLLTSYYEICREQKQKLPEMFQWELCWVPGVEEERARRKVWEKELVEERRREEAGNTGWVPPGRDWEVGANGAAVQLAVLRIAEDTPFVCC